MRRSPWLCGPAWAGRATQLWVFTAAGVPGSTLWLVLAAYTPCPFAEMWLEILSLRSYFVDGDVLSGLLRLNFGHALPFARGVYLADFLLFRGRLAFATGVTVLTQAAVCAMYVREVYAARRLGSDARGLLLGAYLVLLWTVAQMENLISPFQLCFVLSFVAAFAAFHAFESARARAGANQPAGRWVGAAVMSGVIATFSLANGFVVWPLLWLLAYSARPRLRAGTLIAVTGIISGVLFGMMLRGAPQDEPSAAWPAPGAFVLKVLLFLGLPFRPVSGVVAAACAALGVLGAVVLAARHLPRLGGLDRFQRTHLMMVLYVLAACIAVALLRGGNEVGAAGQSRYALPASLFWASLLSCLTYASAGHGGYAPRLRRFLAVGVVTLLAVCVVPAQVLLAPYVCVTARVKQRAGLALIVGVPDPGVFTLFYDLDLWTARPFLRERRLNLFAPDWTVSVGRPLAEQFVLKEDPAIVGQFEEVQPVYLSQDMGRRLDPLAGVQVEGTAWNLRDDEAVGMIVIADDRGIVRGFASSDGLRTDATWPARPRPISDHPWFGHPVGDHAGVIRVPPWPDGIPTRITGPWAPQTDWKCRWFGYARPAEGGVLRAYAIQADGVHVAPLAGAHVIGAPP